MVTAIVSPSARPNPRMTAPMRPVRPYGSTARRIISQRVAPSAYAASRWLCGTARITSLDTDEMIGRSMIARITPPASSPIPYAGPLNSGSRPNAPASAGSTTRRSQGAITKTPHRPRMTLGMDARSSMTNERVVNTARGAISAR